jgi:hypothetical protein
VTTFITFPDGVIQVDEIPCPVDAALGRPPFQRLTSLPRSYRDTIQEGSKTLGERQAALDQARAELLALPNRIGG